MPTRLVELDSISFNLAKALGEHETDGWQALLEAVGKLALPAEMQARLAALRQAKRRPQVAFPYGEDEEGRPRGIVFIAPRGIACVEEKEETGTPATESDEKGAQSDQPVLLIKHSRDVRSWAKWFAETAGLPPNVLADVALASFLHDAGKADPRYQSYFAGGDPYGPDVQGVLAKSGQRRLSQEAWKRAGLPSDWRHEALSVRLALMHPEFKAASDSQLVLWLIGTHHGLGRPLFPHADPKDDEARPDLLKAFGHDLVLQPGVGPQSLAFSFDGQDWPQIFETLKARYGIWGLARLEALVRLADHRASEANAGVSEDRKDVA